MHPLQRRNFEGFFGLPRSLAVKQRGFIEAFDCLRQGVIVVFASTADRELDPGFSQPFAVSDWLDPEVVAVLVDKNFHALNRRSMLSLRERDQDQFQDLIGSVRLLEVALKRYDTLALSGGYAIADLDTLDPLGKRLRGAVDLGSNRFDGRPSG
jgi:hypothetical protein